MGFQTNLVPFPRLHFIFTSMAPINKEQSMMDIQSMTASCFDKNNFFLKIDDFDAEEDKYMAIAVKFEGDIKAKDANQSVQWLKTNKKVSFVEWCPTGFKVGLNDFDDDDDDDDTIGLAVGGARDVNAFRQCFGKKTDKIKTENRKSKKTEHFEVGPINTDIAAMKKGVVMMGNNTAISRVFSERISKKFDVLYSQRAFVHWFVYEGMEEGELLEAREDVGFLEKDYLDVCSEQATDDEDDDYSDDEEIGLAVGGARDVNNFRNCDMSNVPPLESITFNGILYEYHFDTKTRKSKQNTMNEDEEKKQNEVDDNSKLFYPTYCYSKIKKLHFEEKEENETNEEYEYYMTVGLNSNIKKSEFKRKHQNLVIVLDISGSMGFPFNYQYGANRRNKNEKTKMEIANEALVTLIKKLKPTDRFGLVIFDDKAQIIQKLELISDINLDKLYKKILRLKECGGTNFEAGYRGAIKLYSALNKNALNDPQFFNRIVMLTDAQPNVGRTDSNSLLNLVGTYGNSKENKLSNYIYTTFIGIGLDFNSSLIEKISSIRGANYYTVKSSEDFIIRMDQEFDHMVTPLVFNVSLKLNFEGNSCEIDKVYGAKEKKSKTYFGNRRDHIDKYIISVSKIQKKGRYKGWNTIN